MKLLILVLSLGVNANMFLMNNSLIAELAVKPTEILRIVAVKEVEFKSGLQPLVFDQRQADSYCSTDYIPRQINGDVTY